MSLSSLRTERTLLILFLFGKMAALLLRWGEAIGWDSGVHLEMVQRWSFTDPLLPIREHFYAYHPPLAFYLPKLLVSFGLDPVLSVQFISTLASIAAFLFLRATLRHLKLLEQPQGIAFLYLASALPLQVHMGTSINMDVLILAAASAVLYYTIRGVRLGLITALVFGLFTKFTAVLLLPVPFFVALTRPDRWRNILPKAVFPVFIAIALVFPYYYGRYERAEGTLLPHNIDFFQTEELARDRAIRDQDRTKFFREFFWGTSASTAPIEARDQSTMRFLNTWRDLWAGHRLNLYQTFPSLAFSRLYAAIAWPLLVVGLIRFFREKRTVWWRLGVILLTTSLLQLLFIIVHSTLYVHPIGIPNKAIYIPLIVWGVGYLLSVALPFSWEVIAAFVLVNHLLPVY